MNDGWPACAGWHEREPTCDGEPGVEPPCAFRTRCLALVELAGGRAGRTAAKVQEGMARAEGGMLEAVVQRQIIMARQRRRPLDSTRIDARGVEVEVHAPAVAFAHVVPVVNAIARSMAKELGRAWKDEREPLAKGDLYIRFLPGAGGKQAVLYEHLADPDRYADLWLVRFAMFRRLPLTSGKVNTTDHDRAVWCHPPAGVKTVLWEENTRAVVGFLRVGPKQARETGRWLADMHKAGVLGMKDGQGNYYTGHQP